METPTWGSPARNVRAGITIPTDDGDDTTVDVLDLPGHAPEQVGIGLGDSNETLVGDVAIAEGSIAVGAPEGEMRAYPPRCDGLTRVPPNDCIPATAPSWMTSGPSVNDSSGIE